MSVLLSSYKGDVGEGWSSPGVLGGFGMTWWGELSSPGAHRSALTPEGAEVE